jgi:drug/metabolite transporter (DMT)-like permease
MSSSPSYRHVLLLVSAAACWGCGTVLSKLALDRGVAPLVLLAIELAASCLLLSTVALGLRAPWSWSGSTRRLALLGLLNPGLAYALGLLGLVSISASMSVLLWATEPVLILLLAVLVLRERVGPATLIALATALGGVVLVIYRPGAGGDAVGIALTVAAVTACGCYTVLTRRLLLDDSSVAVVLLQQAAALVFALVLCVGAAVGGVALRLPTDSATWALAAASGMVYYGAAFWLFVSGLRGVPASLAGAYLPLIPVFGLAAGYAAGDRLVDRQWLGALLVVLATAAAAVHHLRRRRVTPHG